MSGTNVNDTSALIGNMLDESAQRDAIHIAVLPVVASSALYAGQHVSVKDGIAYPALRGRSIGIVDPFMHTGPMKGERFFVFIKPNTVTGMRHHWQHPDIPETDAVIPGTVFESNQRKGAREWLEDFCARYGYHYSTVMSNKGQMMCATEIEIHTQADIEPSELEAFWKNMEIMYEERFSQEHRDKTIWTCSC